MTIKASLQGWQIEKEEESHKNKPEESHKTKNASEPCLVLVDVALGKEQESALLLADLSKVLNGCSKLVVAEVILVSQGGPIAMPEDQLCANMHETEQ